MSDLAHTSTALLYQLGPIAALFFGVGLAVGLILTAKRVLTGRFRRGRDLAITLRCALTSLAFAVLLVIVCVGSGQAHLTAIPALIAQLALCLLLVSAILWPAPEPVESSPRSGPATG